MPGNVRFDWHRRVKDVDHEYLVARLATDSLAEQVARADVRLTHPLRPRDLRNAADNLQATYVVRLYAVFEAALRSYWTAEVRATRPLAEVLIDRLADRLSVPQSETDQVHEVREARNDVVHESGEWVMPLTLAEVRGRLQTFLKRLPEEW